MLRTFHTQLSLLAATVDVVQAVFPLAAGAVPDRGGIPFPAQTGATPALLTCLQYPVSETVQERRRKRFGPGEPGWGESQRSSQECPE